MRVLEITARYPPGLGGVERNVSELARALAARGHDVSVWTSNLRTLTPRVTLPAGPALESGIHVDRMEAWIPPGLGRMGQLVVPGITFRLLEKAASFDVVHAHGFRFFPVFQAIPALRRTKVPFVISSHASLESSARQRLYDRWVGPEALRYSRFLICETAAEAALFSTSGWSDRVRIIPPGVDRGDPAPEGIVDGSAIDIPGPGVPFILSIGRLASNKGLDILIRAARPLLEGSRGRRLVIAGEDHGALPSLRRLVAELRLWDRVQFLGRVTEAQKVALLQRAEVFAFPSVGGEAWGFAMFEALSWGCPVVASRLGGATALAAQAGAALLAEPGDAEDLRRCLRSVVDHPERRSSWASAGRSFTSQYSWRRMTDATIEVLARAAEGT